MQIYNYDMAGVYTYASLAEQSPLDAPGVFLIPANATAIAPPALGAQQAAVFANGEWAVVPDWRGVPLYLTANGEPTSINEVNVTPASINATSLVPPTGANMSAVWSNGAWSLEPDWRDAPLYALANGAPVSATAIGQTPASLNATNVAPPDATLTWTFNGTAWARSSTLVAAALASAQAAAIQQLLAYANAITAQITSQYPQSEVDSWPAQLVEARLVQAGQTPPAPSILQAMVTAANSSSVTLASLASAVIANATAYQNIVAWVQAIRVSAQAQIAAATDAAQLPSILASLKATANAQAQALGLSVPA